MLHENSCTALHASPTVANVSSRTTASSRPTAWRSTCWLSMRCDAIVELEVGGGGGGAVEANDDEENPDNGDDGEEEGENDDDDDDDDDNLK